MSAEYEFDKSVIKGLISRIEKLTTREKLHILNILKEKDEDYTKNANGYFFNMLNIGGDAIQKLEKCLNLIETNRDLIKEMDKRREDLLMYYKSVIEEKLRMSLMERKQRYMDMIYVRPFETSMHLKISKVNKQEENVDDPDILIKQYYNDKKLPKESAYARLFARLKAKRSKRVFDKSRDIDDDSDFHGHDGVESDIGDVPEHHSEIPDDVDDISISDCCSVTDYADSDDDSQTTSTDDTSKLDVRSESGGEATTQRVDLKFYKALLNERGYKFNEANFPLEYQTYIQ